MGDQRTGGPIEVRVHGVSGSPPRAILYSDPVELGDRPPPDATAPSTGARALGPIRIAASTDRGWPAPVQAYSWARLTSGRPRHALWLLLLPFSFLNLAGWMLPPPRSDAQGRLLHGLVRAAGVLLTVEFTLFAIAAVMDVLISYQQAASSIDPMRPLLGDRPAALLIAAAIAGSVVPALVLFLIGWEPRRRQLAARSSLAARGFRIAIPQEHGADDPARACITDAGLWVPQPLTKALIHLHVGAAILVGWWAEDVVAVQAGAAVASPGEVAAVVAAAVLILVGVVAAGFRVHSRFARLTPAPVGLAAIGFILACWRTATTSQVDWVALDLKDPLGDAALLVLTLFIAIVVLLTVASVTARRAGHADTDGGSASDHSHPHEHVAASAAATAMAALIGGGLGAGAYTLAYRAAADRVEAFGGALPRLAAVDWLAAGLVATFLGFAAATLLRVVRRPVEGSRARRMLMSMRAIVIEPGRLLMTIVVLWLAGSAGFLLLRSNRFTGPIGTPFEESPWIGWTLVVAAVATIGLAILALRPRARALVMAGGGVVLLAVGWSLGIREISVLGARLRYETLQEAIVSIALILPAVIVGRRAVANISNEASRRGFAIFWDVAGFWPRWFHPFAAPVYGPLAVPDLAAHVCQLAEDHDPVILAGHSQGSVLSASAALLMASRGDTGLERVRLLTYGSPIESLYRQLFAAHVREEDVRLLSDRTDGFAWTNMWRETDLIGTPVTGAHNVEDADPDDQGHFGYEPTQSYIDAVTDLLASPGGRRSPYPPS